MKHFIIVSALLLGAFSAKAQFAGGDGSPQDPYQISTVNQLDSIRYFLDNHFILLNDLDIGDWISNHPDADIQQNGWTPIDSVFYGSLNGQGYTLLGFFINRPDDISCGLFEELSTTTYLHDLTIEFTDLFVGFGGGVFAGWGSGKIENCRVIGGTIHANEYFVGGLFGGADSLTAISCSANINIVSDGDDMMYAGGLFSFISNSEIKSCHVKGDINIPYIVGGIAGQTTYSNYTNCSYIGNITGEQQCGGIAGNALNINVNNCYTKGKIETTLTSPAYTSSLSGGLLGITNYSTIRNSYSTMDISTPDMTVGGLLGYGEGDTVQKCYAAGNIEGDIYIGGILGMFFEKAYIEKCVAANLSITTTSNATSDTRRIGIIDMSCDAPQNNFAFEGMLINGERGTPSVGNGEDLSGEDIMRQSTYTQSPLEWDFTPQTGDWKMPSSGCLPILAWQDDISDTADCFLSYLSYLSIKNVAKNEHAVSIYPCPASDYVNIQISDDMPMNDLYAYLYDITGRLLHTQILENKTTRIDLTDFTAGFYVLKVNNHTFKVVKK